jgi:hypothetical protein
MRDLRHLATLCAGRTRAAAGHSHVARVNHIDRRLAAAQDRVDEDRLFE